MDHLMEKQVSSEKIFTGRVLEVFLDEISLPNEALTTREYIRHPGASCVIAITDEEKMLMVRQYRYAPGKLTVEIPAGKLDGKDEDPEAAAKRELSEETGYQCETMEKVVSFYSCPGFADELVHLFVAKGLVKNSDQHLDEDEFVDLLEVTLDEALNLIKTGEICDMKTCYAVQYWQLMSSK